MDVARSPVDVRQAAGLGLLAALVSFAWSWHPSYWYDEAATLSAVHRSLPQLWELVQRRDVVHALYYATVREWVQLVGGAEGATRLFSVIGVGVTCAGVSVLGQRLQGRSLGLAAGLVTAVLPGMSWAGTELREYAWSAAVAVLATILLLRSVESGRTRDWIWYAASVILATYVFLFCLLLLPVHLVTLRRLRADLRRWWVAAAVSLVATAPLVFEAWTQRGQVLWIDDSIARIVAKVALAQNFLGQYYLGQPGSAHWVIGLACAAALLAGSCFVLVAAARGASRDPSRMRVLAVALPWAVLPTAVLVAYGVLATPMYELRYVTFCVPAFSLLLGSGLLQLRGHRRVFVGAWVLLVLLVVPVLVEQRAVDAKAGADYRALATFVAAHQPHIGSVIFADVAANGVRVAYPAGFAGTTILNLAATPAESATLWGTLLPARDLDPASVAGSHVALFAPTGHGWRRDPYAVWLVEHGCQVDGSHWGRRFSIHVYGC